MNDQLQYDAIILAGISKNPKRRVKNTNKAFLEINNRPMIVDVVMQTLKAKRISRIIVVGPREKLESVLWEIMVSEPRVRVVQQRARMLENVLTGFLATFPDGNDLPYSREIEMLLLGGQLPIRRQTHLHILSTVYAAVASYMALHKTAILPRHTILAVMERRFDEFRKRHERAEWFMGKIRIDTILRDGVILKETEQGVRFQNPDLFSYFLEWENRYNKYVFVTSCDLPLLTPEGIDDFLSRCDTSKADFYLSVATEDALKPYYLGKNGIPGIKRPYLHLREAKIRAANLILVAPNKVGNEDLIQESFGIRKMTKWSNFLSLIWKLIKQKNRFQAIRLVIGLQLAAILDRNGFRRMSDFVRQWMRGKQLEEILSGMFMTRFRLIAIRYGGISLDVDTDEDYDRLNENKDQWLIVQNEYVSRTSIHESQIFQRNQDH